MYALLLQVSKPVPNIGTFEALCNTLVADSFSERDVSFAQLESIKAQTVGLFGYNEDVWKVMHEHGILPLPQSSDCIPAYFLYDMPSNITNKYRIALSHAGLSWDLQACQNQLEEGLVVFCPALAAHDTRNVPTASQSNVTNGTQNSESMRVLVCAWAGKSVEEQVTHGPFNLMLRLVVELASGVVVPVGKVAAAELDQAFTPFQSNHGVVQAFAVQKQTSSNTTVSVRISVCSVLGSY